ncbi:MAG: YeeE/YedE thiosulfate transporter family protein [Smithellaceae bacterium]
MKNMNVLLQKQWSPYVAGALAGLLLVLSVFLTGKYFGASTTFVRASGFIEQTVAPEKVAEMAYFVKEKVKVDWQFLFVVGVFFGSLLSAWTSRDAKAVAVPPMWEERFGASRAKRWTMAVLGGAVLMFGARLADG